MCVCPNILKEYDFSLQGNGDKSCEFYVEKVRESGFVTLQSCEKRNLFLGMTEEGHVRPTVDSGAANTRFYPEVIECKYVSMSKIQVPHCGLS